METLQTKHNKIYGKDFFKIGFSSAASWAWGTSLIMGQQIAQEKGIVAWLIWAISNSLTLALFGWLFNRGVITKETLQRKEVKIIALLIQVFCLLVQLNFINKQLTLLIGNPTISYILTGLIGALFTLMVFKKGLPTSIATDVGQWIGAIVAIAVIILYGVINNIPHAEFVNTSSSGVLWGSWSGIVLLAGPIGDVQHWQRAETDRSKKGYYLGALVFALYMCEILGMAFFKFDTVMNTILLAAVMCVTTSTIDSIAVATHEIKNKYVGTAVSLSLCVIWGVFVSMGMLDLWSAFGAIRFAFAVAIILLPICQKGKTAIVTIASVLGMAILAAFTYLGQIKIDSVAGIISVSIAAIIFGYCIANSIYNRRKSCLNASKT